MACALIPAIAPQTIDSHTHFWRYDPADYPWVDASMPALQQDHLPSQLAAILAQQGIDAVVAIQARPMETENQWLIGLAKQHPWIRAIVGWVDLEAASALDAMDHWCARGPLRGFRPMLQDAPDPAAVCAQDAFGRNVRALQDRGLVFELLLRSDQLAFAPAFCRRHDRGTIILDHLGKPPVDGRRDSAAFVAWRNRMAELATLPHVAVKLSGLMTEVVAPLRMQATTPPELYEPYFDTALRLFGPQRLLFGSDWPVCTSAWGYETFRAVLDAWAVQQLSGAEHALLMGSNAARLYGIPTA